MVNTAEANTQDTGTRLREKVSQAREKLSHYATEAESKINESRTGAASGLDRAASGLQTGAEKVAQATQTVAQKLRNAASYVRDKDARSMSDDICEAIRNNPTQALAISLVAGFLVGQIFTSSRERY